MRKLITILIILFAILYSIQVFSPLRLNNDSIIYLTIAESFLNVNGFTYNGVITHYPSGYPFMVSILNYFDIRSSFSLISLNFIFLIMGNIFGFYIFRYIYGLSETISLTIILLSLSSYLFIKHATLPLSDIPFYGISMGAVWMIAKCEKNQSNNLINITWAILLIGIAIFVRVIGVALIPAFLFAIYTNLMKSKYNDITKNQLMIIKVTLVSLVGILILIGLGVISSKVIYVQESIQRYFKVATLKTEMLIHCFIKINELGELWLNIPISKAPKFLIYLMPFMGLILISALVFIFYKERKTINSIDVYVIFGILIIIGYPFYDTRLWLPFFPLIIGKLVTYINYNTKYNIFSRLLYLYLASFVLLGLVSLSYSTLISFASDRFPELYGDGISLKETYKYAFRNNSVADESQLDNEILHLLEKYGEFKRNK